MRDVLKVLSFREFNQETSRKDVVDSFQILKNFNGEISTEKMKNVLCKVFDKVENEHVEELVSNLATSTRKLDDHEILKDDQSREMEFVTNNKELHEELLTRF